MPATSSLLGDGRQRQRQAHRKSRGGCTRCKSRRRKCDEAHPTCGNCERAGVSCSLRNASTAIRPKAAALPHDDGFHSQLNIDDLRLLYQWMAGDGVLFSDHDASSSKRERDHQVKLSLSYPFLLHTILSLSALELYNQDPTQLHFYAQASSHHLAAVRKAQPLLTRTKDTEYSEPVYLFSAFTSLFAFAEPPLRLIAAKQTPSPDILDDLIDAFSMGRGILAVSTAHADNLEEVSQRQSGLWKDEPSDDEDSLREEFPSLIALLELVSNQTNHTEETKEALEAASIKLFAIVSLLKQRPKTHSSARHIQSWPMHVDKMMMELWKVRDPISLIILAHYAVLVNLRQNLWFFERWPPLIYGQIAKVLAANDVDYSSYLDCPDAMLNQTDSSKSGK